MPAIPAAIGIGSSIAGAYAAKKLQGGGATPAKVSGQLSGVAGQAGNAYSNLMGGPTPLEKEYTPISQSFYNAANQARDINMADYGNIMGGYGDFMKNLGGPTKFSYDRVSAQRPNELGEAYGYLREAVPGYREFAQTGGYSPKDIQELRARGISPIRSAYGNTMMELDRARALGGSGGSPNYIAALSRAQRELPGQLSDATTNVNAGLAEQIRQGRLAGLAGISGIGGTMGGLSSDEAGRMLQAALANQSANLQAQGMGEQSRWNLANAQLSGLGGQAGLYGTTPGMASTFGNQALNAYQQRAQLEQLRNQYGLGLLGTQLQGYGAQPQGTSMGSALMGGLASGISNLGSYYANRNRSDGSDSNPYYNPDYPNYVGPYR